MVWSGVFSVEVCLIVSSNLRPRFPQQHTEGTIAIMARLMKLVKYMLAYFVPRVPSNILLDS